MDGNGGPITCPALFLWDGEKIADPRKEPVVNSMDVLPRKKKLEYLLHPLVNDTADLSSYLKDVDKPQFLRDRPESEQDRKWTFDWKLASNNGQNGEVESLVAILEERRQAEKVAREQWQKRQQARRKQQDGSTELLPYTLDQTLRAWGACKNVQRKEYVDLTSLNLNSEDIVSVAYQATAQLKTLDLFGNNARGIFANFLCENLASLPAFQHFSMNSNIGGGVDTGVALARLVVVNKIQSIDASNNFTPLEDEMLQPLWERLQGLGSPNYSKANKDEINTSLKCLKLATNMLRCTSQAFENMISTNRYLTVLDLDGNDIGNAGCWTIATALKENRKGKLRSLKLSQNEIETRGALEIISACAVCKLEFLDLSLNKIAGKLDAFPVNYSLDAVSQKNSQKRPTLGSLTHLNLSGNTITDCNIVGIAACFSTRLRILNLNKNRLTTVLFLKSMKQIANPAPQLCELNLGSNCLGNRGGREFVAIVAKLMNSGKVRERSVPINFSIRDNFFSQAVLDSVLERIDQVNEIWQENKVAEFEEWLSSEIRTTSVNSKGEKEAEDDYSSTEEENDDDMTIEQQQQQIDIREEQPSQQQEN